MTNHAIERALQRYNKEYTKEDLKNIRNNLKSNKIVGKPFKPLNDTGNLLAYVMYQHIPLKVLYNPYSYSNHNINIIILQKLILLLINKIN